MPPTVDISDEDVADVRAVAGELSKTYVSTLIDNLDDAEWNLALDYISAWNEYDPGSVMRLEDGGKQGVYDSDQEALLAIRVLMRNLLGLPDQRDSDLTGGVTTTSVPVLFVW